MGMVYRRGDHLKSTDDYPSQYSVSNTCCSPIPVQNSFSYIYSSTYKHVYTSTNINSHIDTDPIQNTNDDTDTKPNFNARI